MRSPQLTSSIDPSEANAENPTFSRRLQSSTAVHSAPLWLMKATFPGRAMPEAKVALRPVRGLITPRQLGPTRRMPPRATCCFTSRSSATPSGPASLNPAEMTMAPCTRLSTHSRMMAGTLGAGVTTTARSTWSGTAVSVG